MSVADTFPRDSGLAGPNSVAWKINRERVLLLGWAPAILLQLAHPLVAAGVADHSLFIREPRGRLRRLRRTLDAMLALTFGDTAEVSLAAAGINAIHDRVLGTLEDQTARFPRGTSYSAHDPALLCWVHVTLLEILPRAFELFVGSLSPAERDRYCLEASGLAPWLEIPDGYLPTTVVQSQAYMASMLASGVIEITPTARRLARDVLSPLRPALLGPLNYLARVPAIGLLPPQVREAFGLRWTTRDEWLLRTSAATIRRAVPLVPPSLRYWPQARRAYARAESRAISSAAPRSG